MGAHQHGGSCTTHLMLLSKRQSPSDCLVITPSIPPIFKAELPLAYRQSGAKALHHIVKTSALGRVDHTAKDTPGLINEKHTFGGIL